jgi:hypothetical protein
MIAICLALASVIFVLAAVFLALAPTYASGSSSTGTLNMANGRTLAPRHHTNADGLMPTSFDNSDRAELIEFTGAPPVSNSLGVSVWFSSNTLIINLPGRSLPAEETSVTSVVRSNTTSAEPELGIGKMLGSSAFESGAIRRRSFVA